MQGHGVCCSRCRRNGVRIGWKRWQVAAAVSLGLATGAAARLPRGAAAQETVHITPRVTCALDLCTVGVYARPVTSLVQHVWRAATADENASC